MSPCRILFGTRQVPCVAPNREEPQDAAGKGEVGGCRCANPLRAPVAPHTNKKGNNVTPEEAVAKLDAITGDNEKYSWSIGQPGRLQPGVAHGAADQVVLGFINTIAPEVYEAYDRVVTRAGDWWYS